MTYRKSNRRPRVFRDDSAVGIALDLATMRLLAKLVADEIGARERDRCGLPPPLPAADLDLPKLFN